MMQDDRIEQRLRVGGLPDPPADLRGRVLDVAAPCVRPMVGWPDRLWFSRRWRLAAAALLFALIAQDRFSIVPGPEGGGPRQADVQSAQAVGEAARLAGLPPDQADALARHLLVSVNRPAPREDLSIDDLIMEHR